jgi:RND family efflux transporter MFP subunit
VNVTVMTIDPEPRFHETFDLPAIIEPNRVVTVSAEVEGRIERIPSSEGSKVQAGDLLVQLNADIIRPQFEIAEAQLERDRIEFERMKELVDNDATPRSDLDNATTSFATSKAQLEQAKARLERTHILAPISGVLNDTLVEEGEYVQPGMSVAEIVETDTVKVVVEVPERDITFFEVGAEAEVFFSYRGDDKSMTGNITFIDELADQQTRSTGMEIVFQNEKGFLRSGQIVRVRLTRRILKDAVLIPLQAVISMETGYSVYVVGSTEAQRREVVLGTTIKGDQIRVEHGLEAGEKLIISGHRFVVPGQKVNIVEEK